MLVTAFWLVIFLPIIALSQSQNTAIGFGTTILTFVDHDSIVIAADSRHTIKCFGTGKVIHDTTCKIRNKAGVFYAFAGNAEVYIDEVKEFDVYRIMDKSIEGLHDLDSILAFFEHYLMIEWSRVFKLMSEVAVASVLNKPFIELVMVTYKKGKPFFKYAAYFLRGFTSDNFILEHKTSAAFEAPFLNKMGRHTKIDRYLTDNPFYIADITDFKYKMYDMISLEIRSNKGLEVNYPIYSVKINNGSFEWLPLRHK